MFTQGDQKRNSDALELSYSCELPRGYWNSIIPVFYKEQQVLRIAQLFL